MTRGWRRTPRPGRFSWRSSFITTTIIITIITTAFIIRGGSIIHRLGGGSITTTITTTIITIIISSSFIGDRGQTDASTVQTYVDPRHPAQVQPRLNPDGTALALGFVLGRRCNNSNNHST
jgi:hypothetical protein